MTFELYMAGTSLEVYETRKPFDATVSYADAAASAYSDNMLLLGYIQD